MSRFELRDMTIGGYPIYDTESDEIIEYSPRFGPAMLRLWDLNKPLPSPDPAHTALCPGCARVERVEKAIEAYLAGMAELWPAICHADVGAAGIRLVQRARAILRGDPNGDI